MQRLRFNYRMELAFDREAYNHRFSVKCLPVSDEMQHLEDCRLEILPAAPHSYSVDAFGNRIIYGLIQRPHRLFQVKLTGYALCGMMKGHPVRPQTLAMYRYQSVMTRPGSALRAMYQTAACGDLVNYDPEGQTDVLAVADYYTQYLYETMLYAPGSTDIDTTAEEAAELGSGVCQDYAHIMLSLLRMHQIPCRYVVGLMTGEGASHAWVEVAAGDLWYGFDPTNGRQVDDTYLYISFGRDAKDCHMNRGVLTGGGKQTQTVYACVETEERKQ